MEPINSTHKAAPISCIAVTLSPITIPAMTEITVTVRLDSPSQYGSVPHDYAGLHEPRFLEDHGVLIARTISAAANGFIVSCLLNHITEDLPLHSNTCIDKFYALNGKTPSDYSLVETPVNSIHTCTAESTMPSLDLSQCALSDKEK